MTFLLNPFISNLMKKFLLILMLLIPVIAVCGQAGTQPRSGSQERAAAQAKSGAPERVTANIPASLLSNPERVNVPVTELPKAITDNVAKERSGFTVKEANWDWSTTLVPGNIFIYEIVTTNGTKDQILLYNKDGKFLKAGTAPAGK